MHYILNGKSPLYYEEGKCYVIKNADTSVTLEEVINDNTIKVSVLGNPHQHSTINAPVGTPQLNDLKVSYCGACRSANIPYVMSLAKNDGILLKTTEETVFQTEQTDDTLWVMLNTKRHKIRYFHNAPEGSNPLSFELSQGIGLYDKYGWYTDIDDNNCVQKIKTNDYVLYFFTFPILGEQRMRIKIENK